MLVGFVASNPLDVYLLAQYLQIHTGAALLTTWVEPRILAQSHLIVYAVPLSDAEALRVREAGGAVVNFGPTLDSDPRVATHLVLNRPDADFHKIARSLCRALRLR